MKQLLLILQELITKSASVYYYGSTDEDYDPNNPEDYPYVVQGTAYVNGIILTFTILYREENSVIPQQGLDIISNASFI